MHDPITDLVEIVQVTPTKGAKNVHTFKNSWSSRCPKPDEVVTDNGLEFSGNEWEFMLVDWGIQKGKNPLILPWLKLLLNLPIKLSIRFSTQHCMALWSEQRLSCHLMMHVHCVSDIALQGMAP